MKVYINCKEYFSKLLMTYKVIDHIKVVKWITRSGKSRLFELELLVSLAINYTRHYSTGIWFTRKNNG